MHHNAVLRFWFHELSPKQWWQKSSALDELIAHRFKTMHNQAALGELDQWRQEPLGALAEIIILDQFSRNIFRDTPGAFAYDPMALTLSQVAIAQGFDKRLSLQQRSFLYMPFMHSESPKIHEEAVNLFNQPGLEGSLDFEKKHKAIIDRFGRYPHRNSILGRTSTSDELAFLQEPGSSF